MADIACKQKYHKYKLRVKLWEKDFKKKNGRIPSKYDIREASQEIRESYKMYYKMKTSFLEDTLNDVFSEDGFDLLEISQSEETLAADDPDLSLSHSVNDGPRLPLDISAVMAQNSQKAKFSNVQELPAPSVLSNVVNVHHNHVIKQFEATEDLTHNNRAWGAAVSKNTMEVKSSEDHTAVKPSFKSNLSNRLFQSTSFLKRNPRKSLLRTTVDTLTQNDSDTAALNFTEEQEMLPDLETILIQKAKEQQVAAAIVGNPLLTGSITKDSIKLRVNEGWLNRNTSQNGIVSEDIVRKDSNDCNSQTLGLTNINMTKLKLSADCNLKGPQQEREQNKAMDVDCIENGNRENENTLPVAHDSQAGQCLIPSTSKSPQNDSDSVVSESEDECEQQEYRHISKKSRTTAVVEFGQGNYNNDKTTERRQINTSSQATEDHKKSEALVKENVSESKLDFSADDDNDKDFVVENKKSSRSVKAPKRSKKPNEKTMAKLEKKTKQTQKTKERKVQRSKRTQIVKKSSATEEDGNVLLEEPPNPEDLRYTLALENGVLTTTPRAKVSDLQQAEDVAQRYISTVVSTSLKQPMQISDPMVNQKRSVARKKLEEKVASGKLNENFVTINIQKKKFVRGKKTINYSNYKKKLWKDKKRVAALTGPNMYMGGCDGGIQLCFSCGQPGHFAQNCKIKGDSLLPLTVQLEEDPSPFPTLDEAEQMASQSAVAVHSRNISKLPIASNAAFYRGLECSEVGKQKSNNTVSEGVTNTNSLELDAKYEDLIETDDEIDDFNVNNAVVASSVVFEHKKSSALKYRPIEIPQDFMKKIGFDTNDQKILRNSDGALYNLNEDGSVRDVTPEVLETLHMFGHTNFRKGQDKAIMRILSGISTLVTLSTGSGKSLCYQLAAYLYSRKKQSITLVISPLVSLMEDQVHGVPHFLRAHCLHTNQTPQQRLNILQKIKDGQIDILLVSPEAVVAGERSTGFGSILRQLPPIAFACIDEVHCVSQWSHNFRPSYLMICKVLKNNLGINTVLGLTATATLPTRLSIISHLGIPDGERGVISDIPLPDNLILSVSKDLNKDAALLQLLYSERFNCCHSVIIYCTRRDECERISGFLRTSMQDRETNVDEVRKQKRKRNNWQVEPYHAGMPASRRRAVQNAFMRNELRIVVATIAFGMGINKADIRSVIHYNMPRSFESYVQEIGRAGRDGKISHCHLFLDAHGNDRNELRRHIYANSIDRHVIRKLLQNIFLPCACEHSKKSSTDNKEMAISDKKLDSSDTSRTHSCPGHEIGFSIDKTIEALDIPAENISTLLCYMELEKRWCISVQSSAYIMAKVISYGGSKYLKHAAKECAPLAMAIALGLKKRTFEEDANVIEFSVVDIAAAIGWNSGVVKYQLKNLEWVQVNERPKRSPITVTYYDLGFRVKAPGDFTAEEIDNALDTLYERSLKQEHNELIQLQYVFQGLSSVAYNSYVPCSSENFSRVRSDQLKGIIRDYFRNDYPKDLKLEIELNSESETQILNDIHGLLNMYPENNFSGRNVARIFHGISSPNFPAITWGRCKYWRAHIKTNFNQIVQLANNAIVQWRC